jgi:hypothetical protein
VARSVTLQELRDGALDLADELNSGVIAPQLANRLVSQAYSKYYDELIKSGEDYSILQQTIVTAVSTDPAATNDPSIYKLPGDHYETRGLDANLGGQQYATMHRTNWNDRNLLRLWGTTGWFVGIPLRYMLLGSCLRFDPVPTSSFTVTHWYYPVAPTLSQDTQTVDVLSGGDLFIECYAAGLIAQRQESFELADRLFQRASEELERGREMAQTRDAAEPPRTTEVQRRSVFRSRWGT